jgi:hypothetical protein
MAVAPSRSAATTISATGSMLSPESAWRRKRDPEVDQFSNADGLYHLFILGQPAAPGDTAPKR